ncbi:MAG: hypothetical protein ABIH28_00200 [archaeon]
MKEKMNAKSFLVSFIATVSILLLVATASAFTGDLTTNEAVEVDGIDAYTGDVSVIAGEKISIEVYFDSLQDASDVTVKAEIEGNKVDVESKTSVFDVETDKRYKKVLTLQVPYELKDALSDSITLTLTVRNGDYKSDEEFNLKVQRPSYNAEIKSVTVKQTITAGETIYADVVLKNIGYNDLEDVYITASIPTLGLNSGKKYLGDLVALEERDCENDAICLIRYEDYLDEEDVDTMTARIYLDIPYNVDGGIYALEITVENDDEKEEFVKQIIVKNDFSETIMQSGNSVVFVNPTNKIMVYKIIPEYPATVSESVVVVPAGSSKTVTIKADSDKEYKISIFSGETLVKVLSFNPAKELDGQKESSTSPLVALTIILAIIFVILLVVLIVMITKKPEKVEEFGESYY